MFDALVDDHDHAPLAIDKIASVVHVITIRKQFLFENKNGGGRGESIEWSMFSVVRMHTGHKASQ